ncbi:hypothetical protein SpCBS45565_g07961 [Spizellomyces sp. 'palustris']|nr:hypothetical protein SpCBS45565_g07961 [Spizellomyces sp. 'palustris']
MNPAHIQAHIRALFQGILNKDTVIQRQTIERAYFPDATLQNPYLVLSNRDQIIRSYAGLSNSCTEVLGIVKDIEYHPDTQIVRLTVVQTIKPKALGGVLAISTTQVLSLQLEFSAENSLQIVSHDEHHIAQDIIKQMPLIGKYYETSIRTALGHLTLAGTSVLNATGILDLFPAAVRVSSDTASAMRKKASRITNDIALPALEATGVTPLVRDAFQLTQNAMGWATENARGAASLTRSTAVKLIEEGRGGVDCYSPTCKPGQICYSSTCPRGKTYQMLSVDAVADIVKGVYQGVQKSTTGLLKTN